MRKTNSKRTPNSHFLRDFGPEFVGQEGPASGLAAYASRSVPEICGVDSRLRGNDVWLGAEMKKILKSRERTQEVLQNKGLDFLECAKQTQNEPKITAFCCVCGPFLPIQDERSRPATEGDVAQALLPVFDEAIYQPWTQARLPVPRHQRQWDSLSPIERANISGRRR
jgi:hypothetical protein